MTPVREQSDSRLWSAVILQALEDATPATLPKTKEVRREVLHNRDNARKWFKRAGRDFREVCAFAGMDPERVRSAALEKIAEADARPVDENPRLIEHNGERLTAAEWSRRTGLAITTITKRLKKGVAAEQALTPGKSSQAKLYTHNGETHTLVEWSKITGIKANTIQSRLNDGWSLADALTVSMKEAKRRAAASRDDVLKRMHAARRDQTKRYEFDGKSMSLYAWADLIGVSHHTLRQRISAGWSIERALTTPSRQGPRKTVDESKPQSAAHVTPRSIDATDGRSLVEADAMVKQAA